MKAINEFVKPEKLDDESFSRLQTFLINADKAVVDAGDVSPDLDKAIDAMLNRWKNSTKEPITEQEWVDLKAMATKIYFERLKAGESRAVWDVLKHNILGSEDREI